MNRLVFGCGYLGGRVAKRWRAAGDQVWVVTRDSQRAARLEQAGYYAVVADVTDARSLAVLQSQPAVDTLLYAVGYDRSSPNSIHEVYQGGLSNALANAPDVVGRVIYLSTTGVYGDASGEWVDEHTPPNPQRDGARASLAAEDVARASPLAARTLVLRLAGLYGPDRIPFLDRLRAGEPIPTSESGWLNLIHVEDAADVVVELADRGAENGSQLLNAADGNPPTRGDYYSAVARLIDAPQPKYVAPSPDSPRAIRARSDKRVCGKRLLRQLPAPLKYPNYLAGLSSILGNREPSG